MIAVMEHFGDWLTAEMGAHGHSQADVQRGTGLAQSSISCFKTNRREPDIESLGKIATFYPSVVFWLIDRIRPVRKNPP
jgi:transcriptional regulator with XRE-family HTH domain